MFRFHIQGLCISVQNKNVLRVLMLNSGPPRSVSGVDYHLPGLFAKRTAIAENKLPRLPSIQGRWAGDAADAEWFGWNVAGMTVRVGQGSAPTLAPTVLSSSQTEPPLIQGDERDWSDMHWVLDARRMLPTGTLKDEFRRLGAHTTTIFEFQGGRLQGGQPFATAARVYLWKVRDDYTQALTDTIDVIYEAAPTVTVVDVDGRSVGTVVLAETGEAWAVNEAPRLAQNRMETDPDQEAGFMNRRRMCFDLQVYLEAFDTRHPDEKDRVVFERAGSFVPFITTGVVCDALFLNESDRESPPSERPPAPANVKS